MTHALSARLVLLAAAAALALSVMWAMVAAEHRDGDRSAARRSGVAEQPAPAPDAARPQPVAAAQP